MTEEIVNSPLTGLPVSLYRHFETDLFIYDEIPRLGKWAATTEVISYGFMINDDRGYDSGKLRLSAQQTNKLVALARSKVWRANSVEQMPVLFVSTTDGSSVKQTWSRWQVIPLDALWQEAKSLIFEDKAVGTLFNLVQAEADIGKGIRLGLSIRHYPGSYSNRAPDEQYPMGITYGCSESEGLIVLQYLLEQGLIRDGEPKSMDQTTFYVTPKGYAEVDQSKQGLNDGERKAFLICRFNVTLDQVYEEVYQYAGAHPNLRCPIKRVKDIHHVDRIDDRIMQEIKSATIIIVDLTEASDNFNVALEAGYALALKKPIVWTKRDDGEPIRLPFDIHSQNLMSWKYEDNSYGDFVERLQARMTVAIEKAIGKRQ